MRIILGTANTEGFYNPPQEWDSATPPEGYCQIADGVDETPLISNGGFAEFALTNGIITAFTANSEAWEAWKAAHPETPAEPDAMTQTQIALAELAETESAHDLENKLALAELAEMIGGTSNG